MSKDATAIGATTYFVALPFLPSEEGPVASAEAVEAKSPGAALRQAAYLARKPGNCGAIAYSRTGDPSTGEFTDAKVLAT